MTEAELRHSLANARADLAAVPGVRKALLKRREAMLLTATVDENLAVDGEIRVLDVKADIAQAKATAFEQELAFIDRERARWAGVAMPTDAELKELLALVEREHPRLLDRESDRKAYISRNFAEEFKRAFYAVGRVTRLPEPTSKIALSTHIDRLNGLLPRGHAVEADVIFAAAIAWGDVDYRFNSPRYGQLAELSLDPLHNTGRAPSPVWREILAGRPLRKALPPRMAADSSIGLVRTVGG